MSKGNRVFFLRTNTEKETPRFGKAFTEFLDEETSEEVVSVTEDTVPEETSINYEVADTVFGMFDQLEEQLDAIKAKTPTPQPEPPTSYEKQAEVDEYNDLSDMLFAEDVAGAALERLNKSV